MTPRLVGRFASLLYLQPVKPADESPAAAAAA